MLFEISEPNQSANPHEKKFAIGIDLGTTNSLVACFRNGIVDVLADENDERMLPSIVNYQNNYPIVGTQAKNLLDINKKYHFSSFKRLMGKNFSDIEQDEKNLAYDFNKNNSYISFNTPLRDISPVELSAIILSKLKQIAEQTISGTLAGAVITVPAYFNEAQRQATKDAAQIAGIEVLRLINEPTAAALAYGIDNKSQGYFAIYDLGGGTFDISILNVQEEIFEVTSTAGNTNLGGDDFDLLLAKYICKETSLKLDSSIISQAKYIKEYLTQNIEYIFTYSNNNQQSQLTITRANFDSLVNPLIENTITLLYKAVKDSQINICDLNGIILVGGSTRMPIVQCSLEKLLPKKILTNLNPDEVVAIGAAMQANSLIKGADEWLLLDVIPLSLGIETMGGLVEKIIERNSTIPITKIQEFTTSQDGQTAIKIHVVQGEREQVENCRSLGTLILNNIPSMTAGMARIQVEFNVDVNGLLKVTASEKSTKNQVDIKIQPSYGLDEDTILNILTQSFENAESDLQYRMLQEEVVNAKQLIYTTEKALANDQQILTPEQISLIKNSLANLHQSLQTAQNNNNTDLLKQANDIFSQQTEFFADIRMNLAVKKALCGKNINQI